MSLKFKILDERATTIVEKGEFRFFEGEDRTLKVQIIEDFDNSSRMIAAGGTISFTLPASPTNLTKAGVIDTENRSIVTISLSDTETAQMISGNLLAEITETTVTRFVKSEFVLKKLPKTPN